MTIDGIRNFGLGAVCVLVLASVGNAQAKDEPTNAEIRDSRRLAKQFIDDYQNRRSIRPLIRKYFVSDFGRRARFCWTNKTDECEGFGRDFWNACNEEFCKDFSEEDFLRYYTNAIDYMFLTGRLFHYSLDLRNKTFETIEDEEKNEIEAQINEQLKKQLKDKPELMKLGFLDSGWELWWSKQQTPGEFRQMLNDAETYVDALRRAELKMRGQLLRKRPQADFHVKSTDFRIEILDVTRRFFDFPKGTRMIQAWSEQTSLVPFILEMVQAKHGLKIVAAYPPMD